MRLYRLKQIETPRLVIRPVQLGDEVFLHEAIEHSIVALERWMPWARGTNSEATRDFIQRGYDHWQARDSKDFPLLVIHKESQTVISASGYNEHTNLTKPVFEIGYWIDSRFTGQGLATELVNALTRYALGALKAIRVQICTQVENKKSTAVAVRCGYQFEAMLRHICVDCTSRLPSDGQLFSCHDIAVLPPLDVSWEEFPPEPESENGDEEGSQSFEKRQHAQALPTIHTKRLFIRAPKLSDNEKLYGALMRSLDDASSWFSWMAEGVTRRHVQRHIEVAELVARDVLAAEYLFYVVFDRDQKAVLGEIWLKTVDWAVPNIQMAFWFNTEDIGNHDICDALFEVTRFAFARRNAKCVQLYLSEKQEQRYGKLVRRLGFKKEGELKNYFRDYLTNHVGPADAYSMIDFSQLKKFN